MISALDVHVRDTDTILEGVKTDLDKMVTHLQMQDVLSAQKYIKDTYGQFQACVSSPACANRNDTMFEICMISDKPCIDSLVRTLYQHLEVLHSGLMGSPNEVTHQSRPSLI